MNFWLAEWRHKYEEDFHRVKDATYAVSKQKLGKNSGFRDSTLTSAK